MATSSFDPTRVNLTDPDFDLREVVCYVNDGDVEYDGHLGARISSIFVIFFVSTVLTLFPVLAKQLPRLRIPLLVYLFARFFGAGVIIATAFIHLLDPAYGEIGPNTCVGMTGTWAIYSWCPAIVLTSVTVIFLIDLVAERYVEMKYGIGEGPDVKDAMTGAKPSSPPEDKRDVEQPYGNDTKESDQMDTIAFKQQFAAFLILEFGVIFHSVIIGLNLGTAGEEFTTLYIVLVFHQSFEGMGIGARLSAIPFPRKLRWLPTVLCVLYGLTTPISIAAGLGVRTTYEAGSYTANVVSGVLDAISAGILIYTGLVELLARDFLFNMKEARNGKMLLFKVGCLLLGAGLMALLGKWA